MHDRAPQLSIHACKLSVQQHFYLEMWFPNLLTDVPTFAEQEPRSEEGSSEGAKRGQPQREPTKWEEIHTDYIYTQDVKHP